MTRKFKIVPLRRAHLKEVHQINLKAFTSPWGLEDFEAALNRRATTGLVSLCDDQVAGYLIYERVSKTYFLLNMACSWRFARQGVVSGMVNYVKTKLEKGRFERIETDVPEVAEACIRMLKKVGFQATGVNHDQFEGGPDKLYDGYVFVYSLPCESYRNRLDKFYLQQRKKS